MSGEGGGSSADAVADVDDLDTAANPVVLFDGVCNLCTGWVQFIVPRDGDGTLRFAPLQSDAGAALLEGCGYDAADRESIVLVEDGECSRKSTAVLRIAAHLDAPWPFARHLRAVPRPLRDVAYDLVARYRYDVFGRKEQCMVPSAEIRDRFLAMTDDEGEVVEGDATAA